MTFLAKLFSSITASISLWFGHPPISSIITLPAPVANEEVESEETSLPSALIQTGAGPNEHLENKTSSESAPARAPYTLEIQNVRSIVSLQSVAITWDTSVQAHSQLLLDNGNGKGYESLNGISTHHKIVFEDPGDNTRYDFKIVARTTDSKLEDTYYGSFTGAIRPHAAFGTPEYGCTPIIILDSKGSPIADMPVSLSGMYGYSGELTWQLPKTNVRTNGKGLISDWPGCKATSFALKIVGKDLEATLKK